MTTLLVARQKFCELSGRYDLASKNVADFDTDNGADFFITEGQRMLDRLHKTPKDEARFFNEIAAGIYYQTFQNCRAILEVWINNDEERWKLEKVSLADLREYYSGLISATDQGEPAYYSPAKLRWVDKTDKDSLGSFFNYVMDDDEDYNGVIIMPPPDEAMVIEVVGRFYSDSLSSNTDNSYWTVEHNMTLVWAALYKLEVSYRNSEGAKDWMAAITNEIKGIDMDTVEEEIAELEEMDG